MAAIHDLIAQVADERLAADWARALARFAERHGARFGPIQLIRRRRASGGAERFVSLDLDRRATMERVLLLNTPALLDSLFNGVH